MPKKDIKQIDVDLLERPQVIGWIAKEGIDLDTDDLKIPEIAITDRTEKFISSSKSSLLMVPATMDPEQTLTKIDLSLLKEIIKVAGDDGNLIFTGNKDHPVVIEYEASAVIIVIMPLND